MEGGGGGMWGQRRRAGGGTSGVLNDRSAFGPLPPRGRIAGYRKRISQEVAERFYNLLAVWRGRPKNTSEIEQVAESSVGRPRAGEIHSVFCDVTRLTHSSSDHRLIRDRHDAHGGTGRVMTDPLGRKMLLPCQMPRPRIAPRGPQASGR